VAIHADDSADLKADGNIPKELGTDQVYARPLGDQLTLNRTLNTASSPDTTSSKRWLASPQRAARRWHSQHHQAVSPTKTQIENRSFPLSQRKATACPTHHGI